MIPPFGAIGRLGGYRVLDHACTSANCPQCGVLATTLQREVLRHSHNSTPWKETFEALPPARMVHTHGNISTFRDSRGESIARMPSALLPSTTVIITRHAPHGEVLVQQRADNGWWGFPGGVQEIGESIVQCAQREALEETGLTVTLERLVCVDSDPCQGSICCYPDGNIVQYCNLTFTASIQVGVLRCSPESREIRWAPIAALPEPFLPTHRWRLAHMWTKVEVR